MSAPHALVAGASGGLGSALAMSLAQQGYSLTLVGRDQGRLDALPVDGQRLVFDLRDPAACESVVSAAHDFGGGLDVVVNAVGVVAFGTLTELSPDVIEELFLTNTFVAVWLARAALPLMRSGGVIVNLSGVIAERNLPGMSAYGASKAAVRALDEGLAREARRAGVRVLDARPPHTETGLVDRAIAGTPPKFGPGLDPAVVAAVIVDAIGSGVTDLPSEAFSQ